MFVFDEANALALSDMLTIESNAEDGWREYFEAKKEEQSAKTAEGMSAALANLSIKVVSASWKSRGRQVQA